MLGSSRFSAEKLVKSLKPVAFGLDLHWLVHAQGSLALAAIAKKHHPGIPVIFGGLSASYYHEELIRYPQVDYVIRGDSTEEPLCRLLSAVKEKRSPDDVPNLTWKDGAEVRVNRLSHVPPNLDRIPFDYREIMRSCASQFDIAGHFPFRNWFRYPIVAALSCRGCVNNCVTCGGSASTYRDVCARSMPAYRSPDLMARDMAAVSRDIKAPIIVLGDILQAGEQYARELLAAMKHEKVRNHVALEFFRPPDTEFIEMIADAIPKFNIQISPESHDEGIREKFGRRYGNDLLEKSIGDALDLGCRRVDVFFMIGIPGQTPESVGETVQYCEELLKMSGRIGHDGKIHPYISPLAPFLDPGSRAFEEPEKYGYRVFYRTLEEHRRALLEPSWKYTLNYETKWMSRDRLVEVTYEAAVRLNGLKLDYGLVSRKEAARIAARIGREMELIREIDETRKVSDKRQREAELHERIPGFEAVGPSTICRKDEMMWPTALVRFNPRPIIQETMAAARASRFNPFCAVQRALTRLREG